MRPERKKRIDARAAQAPLGDLAGAFSSLNLALVPPETTPLAVPVAPARKMGRVVLRRERAHRGGKTVIVVDDFASHMPPTVIENTARKIRAACGCGGTVKDRSIEVQGDQAGKIRAVLEAEGFQVAGVR